uniref:Uncharacterized protein n=1 Tax=Leersia perrieri TaxID=77586 RepID=A0A0D9XTY3_9ORYZ
MAETSPAPAAATISAGGDSEQQKPPPAKVRMPDDYVFTILALKREDQPSPEYLDRLSPEKREEKLAFAARYKHVYDKLEKLQEEVRNSIKENGCYLVDESYLVEMAANEAKIKEEWAKLDWEGSGIEFGEWDYDDPQCVKYL